MRRIPLPRSIKQIIPITRLRPNIITILLTRNIQIHPLHFFLFRKLHHNSPFIRQTLHDLWRRAREDSPSEGGDEDGFGAERADVGDEYGEVGGVLRERNVGGGFLVVVAKGDCDVDLGGGGDVGGDAGEEGGPVAAGAEGDCCCSCKNERRF